MILAQSSVWGPYRATELSMTRAYSAPGRCDAPRCGTLIHEGSVGLPPIAL